MKFALTQEVSSEISQEKINLITSISNDLKSFFEKKEYGNGVKQVFIGIICVAPSYEWFCKVREPRFQKISKIHLPNHEVIVSENVLSMDIKLDFERVRICNNGETIDNVKSAILGNLDKLEKYKGKFDFAGFKHDMQDFLSNKK